MAARLTIKQLRTQHIGPVDLVVEAGDCVVVSGASGAGKTLMLRAIADLDVHQGELFLDGIACEEVRADEWRCRVGLLPAESQWWGERIGDHFGPTDEVLLGSLGFTREVMEWEVARSSTGERQRLALLRQLQNRPSVLLLDEPTASLDAENVTRVEKLIERLRQEQGLAVIWVSHDAGQAKRVATRQMQMVNGMLREQG